MVLPCNSLIDQKAITIVFAASHTSSGTAAACGLFFSLGEGVIIFAPVAAMLRNVHVSVSDFLMFQQFSCHE